MSAAPPLPDSLSPAAAEWAQFVQTLAAQLAALWPAMPGKLGQRYASFVDHAVQQALRLGLTRAAAVARYANLWFVWGSGFQDKPGFEWAAALLAAPPASDWNTAHQLVQRSLQELAARPDARIAAAALAAADAHLLQAFSALGAYGDLHPAEPPPAPRAACDLQAAELRVLSLAVSQAYDLEGGNWQRVALPDLAPLRVHAAQPLPARVALLSHAQGESDALTRVQARLNAVAVCDADVHPELRLTGSHGLWRWRGHEARSCSWPVLALTQAAPPAGPGTAVGEETAPDVLPLAITTCGLRDSGEPLGVMSTQLWVWPASQWWLQLRRQAAPAQPWPASQPSASMPRPQTRCTLEQDGTACDAALLRRGFEDGLDVAAAQAQQALYAAWLRVPGLAAAAGEGVLALLVGQAALTWGWRLGPGGLDGRALMRLVADLQLQAVRADWQLEGELTFASANGSLCASANGSPCVSASAHLQLRCQGQAPLAGTARRETTEPPLLALLPQLQTRFKLPLQAELTPLAGASAALLQPGGPVTGALVGEAGLRPRSRGGSGFEWFASLRLEAVQLPVRVIDPVQGQLHHTLTLLPAMTLLDWSLG